MRQITKGLIARIMVITAAVPEAGMEEIIRKVTINTAIIRRMTGTLIQKEIITAAAGTKNLITKIIMVAETVIRTITVIAVIQIMIAATTRAETIPITKTILRADTGTENTITALTTAAITIRKEILTEMTV
jgi:hypothetical protein